MNDTLLELNVNHNHVCPIVMTIIYTQPVTSTDKRKEKKKKF